MLVMPKNRIAIEPMFEPSWSRGGIYIPEQAKGRVNQGLVKYIGEGCKEEFNIGDHVLFGGYAGTSARIEGELLILIHKRFIVAKVDDIDSLKVPGLFFKDSKGKYFPANYEVAVTMLADAVSEMTKIRSKHWRERLETRDGISKDELLADDEEE